VSAQELLTGEDMAMDDDEADDDGADDMDEDEAMAQALAMSMEGTGHADDAAVRTRFSPYLACPLSPLFVAPSPRRQMIMSVAIH
jgi:hypothetical protein